MERRVPQGLDRSHCTRSELRVGDNGSKSQGGFDFELELQTNSWLRINLSAKDTKKKFTNLFSHFTVANLREAYHALDGKKAVGIDGISKETYGKHLDQNLRDLVARLHTGTYRPLPKKGVEIPKTSGKMRPIAISSFEDKLVEWVLAKTLSAVYEPMFVSSSFGFRPGKSAHDAIKKSFVCLKDNERPCLVEIDLANFFDSVPQKQLMRLIGVKIKDPRIHGLIARFLGAGVLNEVGALTCGDIGTPQGSIISPVLANIYLHYALDTWFVNNFANHGGVLVRYADDAIFLFREKVCAADFYSVLGARLKKYGLQLNAEKSGIIEFDKRDGNVFHFLGFTFYWKRDPGSSRRSLRVKTERKRLFKQIKSYQEWIKENRCRRPLAVLWRTTAAKLRGHYNYYGFATNRRKLNNYYNSVVWLLFKWINNRSQRQSYSWVKFKKRLEYQPLPKPPPLENLKQFYHRKLYDVL